MFPLKDSVVWLIQSNIIGFPIQASTGGGGTYRRQKTIRSGIPNPCSDEGSDRALETRVACLYNFNPRSHEGSDVVPLHRLLPRQDFNPRSREGSDLNALPAPRILHRISIHAPVKGATPYAIEKPTDLLF